MSQSTLAESLRSFRGKSHLYQKEVAAKLHISRVYYCKLENGKAKPSLELFLRICSITGTQTEPVEADTEDFGNISCDLCRSLSLADRRAVRRIIRAMLKR